MAADYLVAQDLHKSFNEHKVVNGVSFTIYKGEIFGLLGPNGAGKTTTIRMLSTVLEPDQGNVTIGGHSIRQDADAVRSLIGVCPQDLALYEDPSKRPPNDHRPQAGGHRTLPLVSLQGASQHQSPVWISRELQRGPS